MKKSLINSRIRKNDLKTDELSPLAGKTVSTKSVKVPRHKATSKAQTSFEQILVFNTKSAATKSKITAKVVSSGKMRKKLLLRVQYSGLDFESFQFPKFQTTLLNQVRIAKTETVASSPSMSNASKLAISPHTFARPKLNVLRMGKRKITPFGVFGADNRVPYFDARYPWSCLVRVVDGAGNGRGSGSLVGPRHVLTCSHVVDWVNKRMSVRVLQNGMSWLSQANVVRLIAYKKILNSASISSSDQDEDYAVLVLDRPLGGEFSWLGVRTYESRWDNKVSAWRSIGYPGANGDGWNGTTPSYQKNFFLDEQDWDYGAGRAMDSKTLDAMPGQSGAPIFGFFNDGPYVVGVVQGGDTARNSSTPNIVSGGSLMTSLVKYSRDTYP